MRLPQLKSTFARAVVPVAAGIAFFALLALLLWGVAALVSGGGATTNFAASTQELGSVAAIRQAIENDGPIVLQDLVGSDRHVVLDYTDANGFALYLAHPKDQTSGCVVKVVPHTHTFTDCTGRTLTVDGLAPVPHGVGPVLSNDGKSLSLDLTADTSTSSPGTTKG
jgi:hypothetical protein